MSTVAGQSLQADQTLRCFKFKKQVFTLQGLYVKIHYMLS